VTAARLFWERVDGVRRGPHAIAATRYPGGAIPSRSCSRGHVDGVEAIWFHEDANDATARSPRDWNY
jgi:hypothetical protein